MHRKIDPYATFTCRFLMARCGPTAFRITPSRPAETGQAALGGGGGDQTTGRERKCWVESRPSVFALSATSKQTFHVRWRRTCYGLAMLFRSILIVLCLTSCVANQKHSEEGVPSAPVSMTLIDQSRQRPVDVLLYGHISEGHPKPLAIISHRYGGHNSDYSFIADRLAVQGYLVASVEHAERPGDPPMVNTGDLGQLRRPVWQVGADSIGFVISERRRRGYTETTSKPILIGHSNGGDMTMLYATEHPQTVRIALSLDNRRMPLPLVKSPKICSIRSDNFNADPGVLPPPLDQQALGMTILKVPVKHDDMWDGGTRMEKEAILKGIATCIDKHVGSHRFRKPALRSVLS